MLVWVRTNDFLFLIESLRNPKQWFSGLRLLRIGIIAVCHHTSVVRSLLKQRYTLKCIHTYYLLCCLLDHCFFYSAFNLLCVL